jgi:peroxiredoxin
MKPFLKIGILVFIVAGLGYMIYAMIQKANEPSTGQKAIENIPAFEITRLNGTIMTRKDIKPDVPAVFLWFDPTCDHCQEEISDLVKHNQSLRKVQLIMVAETQLDSLIPFAHHYGVDTIAHFTMASDSQGLWKKAFKPNSPPVNFIYSKKGILLERVVGECTASLLLKKISAGQ